MSSTAHPPWWGSSLAAEFFFRPPTLTFGSFAVFWVTRMHSISFESSDKGANNNWFKKSAIAVLSNSIAAQNTPVLLHKIAFVPQWAWRTVHGMDFFSWIVLLPSMCRWFASTCSRVVAYHNFINMFILVRTIGLESTQWEVLYALHNFFGNDA